VFGDRDCVEHVDPGQSGAVFALPVDEGCLGGRVLRNEQVAAMRGEAATDRDGRGECLMHGVGGHAGRDGGRGDRSERGRAGGRMSGW